jgi:hypothetical protein
MKAHLSLAGLALFVACSDAQQQAAVASNPNAIPVSMTLANAQKLPECSLLLANQLVWLVAEKEFRTCNAETLNWDVVDISSALPAERTASISPMATMSTMVESSPSGCSTERVTGGVNILCGENAPVFIADGAKGDTGATGAKGDKGDAGSGCTVARSWAAPYYGSAVITCGSTSVTMPDARISMYKGPLDYPSVCSSGAGQQINFYYDLNHNSMFDNDDEPLDNVYVCDGVAGAQGVVGNTGGAGTSCSVASTTGGANVTCGSNTVFIANGSDAAAPKNPVIYHDGIKVGRILALAQHNGGTDPSYQVEVEGTSQVVRYVIGTGLPGFVQAGSLAYTDPFAAPTYNGWSNTNAPEYYQLPSAHEALVTLEHVFNSTIWYQVTQRYISTGASVWHNNPMTPVTGYRFVWERVPVTDTRITRLTTIATAEIRYE